MGVGQSRQDGGVPGTPQSQYLIRVANDFPYFVLCFRRPLTATLILHNKDVLHSLEQSVLKRWPSGIKKIVQANQDGSAEVQLAEDSFRTLADLLELVGLKPELVFNFKRFFCEAFTDFRVLGWRVALSTDTWTRYPALSTLIFEQCPQSIGGDQIQIFALSLSFEGNLLLVNASERVKSSFREIISKQYPPGVLEVVSYGTDTRYRLAGSPWTAWPGDQSIRLARRLLLECFRRFYDDGCKFYATMNTADFGDTIFFEEDSARASDQESTVPKSKFMCLTFYNENKIHLISPPEAAERLLDILTDSVKTYWHLGLKAVVQCPDDQSYEITLKGAPFIAVADTTDAPKATTPDDSASWQARFFMCHLFQNLLARGGWEIEACFDAHKKNYDTATYVLKQRPDGHTSILQHCSLSFDRLNLIRLVNDVHGELAPTVRQVINGAWSKGVVKEVRMEDVKGYEFKLSGQPWFTCLDGLYANSLDGIAAQTLVCLLFDELKKANWKVVASGSTCCLTLGRGRLKQRSTADTWLLVKEASRAGAAPAPEIS